MKITKILVNGNLLKTMLLVAMFSIALFHFPVGAYTNPIVFRGNSYNYWSSATGSYNGTVRLAQYGNGSYLAVAGDTVIFAVTYQHYVWNVSLQSENTTWTRLSRISAIQSGVEFFSDIWVGKVTTNTVKEVNITQIGGTGAYILNYYGSVYSGLNETYVHLVYGNSFTTYNTNIMPFIYGSSYENELWFASVGQFSLTSSDATCIVSAPTNGFTLDSSQYVNPAVFSFTYSVGIATASKIVSSHGDLALNTTSNDDNNFCLNTLVEFKSSNYALEDATPTPTPTATPSPTPLLGVDWSTLSTFYGNVGSLLTFIIGAILVFLGILLLIRSSQAWVVGVILLVAGFFLQVLIISSPVVLIIFAIEAILYSACLYNLKGRKNK